VNETFIFEARRNGPNALRRCAVPLCIALICIALSLGGDAARELLRYERTALADGELWRLVTAHLVHLSFGHVLLNVAALGVLCLLFAGMLDGRDWLVTVLVSALAIDLGLGWLSADVEWYVGLSGVLHGIMATGSLALTVARAPIGLPLIVLIVGKISWEQWAGPLPFSELTSGGPVISAAHLYGALGGCAAYLGLRLIRRSKVPCV
jgi:rhomboid family GlyGly-CTERM serine protease